MQTTLGCVDVCKALLIVQLHPFRCKQPPNPCSPSHPRNQSIFPFGGVLLTSLEAEPTDADLAALVTRLVAEVDQLRAEVARLRRENLEWRQQAGYWQSRHADALRRLAAVEQENEQLRGENRKLQAERFGRHSESNPIATAPMSLMSLRTQPTPRPSRSQTVGRSSFDEPRRPCAPSTGSAVV